MNGLPFGASPLLIPTFWGFMDIQTFFNPYDVRHLKAFKVLNATGAWPAGFIPDNVVLGSTWQVLILNKMALAWLEQAEAANIFGMPGFDQVGDL